MDNLYGFLLGLLYLPATLVIAALLSAAGAGRRVSGTVAALITLAGPIAWFIALIQLGVGAGFAAFGGWLFGLGVAIIIIGMFIKSRLRRLNLRNRWTRAVGD